jgi:hypothetical protein
LPPYARGNIVAREAANLGERDSFRLAERTR